MKKKKLSIQFRGRIGPLIISLRNGKYYARLAPANIKQAAVTKRYNSNFGIASTAGSVLRQQLNVAMPFPKLKRVQSRFAGRIMSWLGQLDVTRLPSQTSLPFISGFSFNEKASLSASCNIVPAVIQTDEDKLIVQLPAFIPTQTFNAPAGTVMIECVFAAACCNLLQLSVATCEAVFRLQVPYTGMPVPAQSIPLLLTGTKGCLLVTVLRLNFTNAGGTLIAKPACMPAAVVDARYCPAID